MRLISLYNHSSLLAIFNYPLIKAKCNQSHESKSPQGHIQNSIFHSIQLICFNNIICFVFSCYSSHVLQPITSGYQISTSCKLNQRPDDYQPLISTTSNNQISSIKAKFKKCKIQKLGGYMAVQGGYMTVQGGYVAVRECYLHRSRC